MTPIVPEDSPRFQQATSAQRMAFRALNSLAALIRPEIEAPERQFQLAALADVAHHSPGAALAVASSYLSEWLEPAVSAGAPRSEWREWATWAQTSTRLVQASADDARALLMIRTFIALWQPPATMRAKVRVLLDVANLCPTSALAVLAEYVLELTGPEAEIRLLDGRPWRSKGIIEGGTLP